MVVVIQNAVVGFDGGTVALRRGEAWDDKHPVVLAHPHLFSDKPPPEHRANPKIEQATAAPGERRAR
jgi:hypothetical protein